MHYGSKNAYIDYGPNLYFRYGKIWDNNALKLDDLGNAHFYKNLYLPQNQSLVLGSADNTNTQLRLGYIPGQSQINYSGYLYFNPSNSTTKSVYMVESGGTQFFIGEKPNANNTQNRLRIQYGSSGKPNYAYMDNYTGPLLFRIGSTATTMTLKENGSVGIGVDPTEKLDVNGTVKGTKLRSQNSTGYAEMNAVAGYFNFSTDRPYFYFNKPVRITGGNIGSNSGDLNLQTAGSTKVTVLSTNGNMGIGTTAPAYKLHVNGDAKVNNNLRVAGDQYLPNNKSLILGHETDKKQQLRLRFDGSSYINYGGSLYFYSNELNTYTAMIHENGDFYIGWGAIL